MENETPKTPTKNKCLPWNWWLWFESRNWNLEGISVAFTFHWYSYPFSNLLHCLKNLLKPKGPQVKQNTRNDLQTSPTQINFGNIPFSSLYTHCDASPHTKRKLGPATRKQQNHGKATKTWESRLRSTTSCFVARGLQHCMFLIQSTMSLRMLNLTWWSVFPIPHLSTERPNLSRKTKEAWLMTSPCWSNMVTWRSVQVMCHQPNCTTSSGAQGIMAGFRSVDLPKPRKLRSLRRTARKDETPIGTSVHS